MKTLRNIRIEGGSVKLDGSTVFSTDREGIAGVARDIYRHYELEYPKFHKMSALSKLGFLAAEILLAEGGTGEPDPDKVALVLANASSSLHTDHAYQATTNEKPSPALFVYTLPNIMIGEICIRHGFKGEGLFFIQESFDKSFVTEYAGTLIRKGRADLCLAGWVDVDPDGNYLADIDLLG